MNFFNDDSNKKPTEGNPVTVSAETEGVPQKTETRHQFIELL